MKKIQKSMSWLVMAAALTIGTTSCSNEDMVAENNEPAVMQQAQQKVHITVGAGVGTSGNTRSTVDYNSGTKERTLKFTEGDKLYVRATIEEVHDDNYDGPDPECKHESKIMAGFLTIDPATISADGKSAQFTGDLDIYVGTVEPEYDKYYDEVEDMWMPDYGNIINYYLVFSSGTHTFLTTDPLAECVYARATLVHADSETKYTVDDNFKSLNDHFKYLDYDYFVASSVNELMTSSYVAGGAYDKDNHSFGLWSNNWYSAILNCTISGLTPGDSYAVILNYGDTEEYDHDQEYNGWTIADSEGKATFAITAPTDDCYYQLALSSTADHKLVTLGRKALATKVYNITTTATDYVFPAGAPIVSGTMAWPKFASWDGSHWYIIKEDPANVSISGGFTDYSFDIENGGTVSLNNVTAIFDNTYIIYSNSSERDLTVVLTGNNSLSSSQYDFALGSAKGIKLRCTGSSATLTVTAAPNSYGFNCTNFYGINPEDLAADGYTVALTNTEEGPDSDDDGYPDYVTWTYTVTKN